MSVFGWMFIIMICFVGYKSLAMFIQGGINKLGSDMRGSHFSIEVFYTLIVTYIITIVGFALIYFTLSFEGIILVENGELRDVSIIGSIIHSLYFSGVTMLTIGYGDIIPIGIGRLIAVIEALIGYVLPTAFVIRIVQNVRDNRND